MGMVGHAMIYKVIICLCHGSLTNKTKQNKTKQNKTKPLSMWWPNPHPPFYQASQFLLFINLSPVSSDKFETLGGKKHPHPSIRTRRRMSWCKLSKASSQKWPFPRLEIDFAASVVLIPQKNNGEKAIPIWGIQAIKNFLEKVTKVTCELQNYDFECAGRMHKRSYLNKQLDRIKVLTFNTTFKKGRFWKVWRSWFLNYMLDA